MKLHDLIKLNQLLILCQYHNGGLPNDLDTLFLYTIEIHDYPTRESCNSQLYIPKVKTTKYGLNSLQFSAASLWNNFSWVHPEIMHIRNTHSLKSCVKKYFIEQYSIQFIKFATSPLVVLLLLLLLLCLLLLWFCLFFVYYLLSEMVSRTVPKWFAS